MENTSYTLLDGINSPADIKNLNMEQLKQLCEEIRSYMIECCAVNPGHLGSSLGAIELMVGLHYVYDTPSDKLVFDVGHQAYAHKIITGRREAFKKNRMKDGISGFPKRSESEYDAFGVGHSSTSISAALGFAENAIPKRIIRAVIQGADLCHHPRGFQTSLAAIRHPAADDRLGITVVIRCIQSIDTQLHSPIQDLEGLLLRRLCLILTQAVLHAQLDSAQHKGGQIQTMRLHIFHVCILLTKWSSRHPSPA